MNGSDAEIEPVSRRASYGARYRNFRNGTPLLNLVLAVSSSMGKTSPTYRDTVREFETEWSTYHRALRTQHQDHFERLFDQVRNFADAGGMQNHHDPMTTHLISILLAHECRLGNLEERVGKLEDRALMDAEAT